MKVGVLVVVEERVKIDVSTGSDPACVECLYDSVRADKTRHNTQATDHPQEVVGQTLVRLGHPEDKLEREYFAHCTRHPGQLLSLCRLTQVGRGQTIEEIRQSQVLLRASLSTRRANSRQSCL